MNAPADSPAASVVDSLADSVADSPTAMSSTQPLQLSPTAEDTEKGQRGPSRQASRIASRVPSAVEPVKFSALHEILFVAIISAGQLLTQAGLTQAIAPLHVIGDSFGVTNPGQLSWLPAAYSLTVGTFILIAGRWGDLYGHKRLFVIGYFWFALFSFIAGFAVYSKSIVFFAVCRALQGMGPALLLPNGIAVLSRIYPPGPRKDMVLSIFGATAPGGSVLGAVFSGVFTQFLWWPWAYWAMALVLCVTGLLAIMIIPEMPVVGGDSTIEELDILGSLFGVTGLVLINFSWNQGPVVGWDTVYVYVILIIGFGFLSAFIFVELRVSKYPLLPLSSFSRDTKLVFAIIAAGWASFGIWVFYLWQFLEVLRNQSILLSAAQVAPSAISGACAAIATGFLIGRTQPGVILLAAMVAFATGIILLATMPIQQTYWAQTFVSIVITCWGMDLSFPSGVIILSNEMPAEHQGLAASLVNTVVNYSISIGLGMAGTVEAHVNEGGENILKGYRGAWYLGIGLDIVGIVLAVVLIFSWHTTHLAKSTTQKKQALTS